MLVDGVWSGIWEGYVIKTRVVAHSMLGWLRHWQGAGGQSSLGPATLWEVGKVACQNSSLKWWSRCPTAPEGAAGMPCVWALPPML